MKSQVRSQKSKVILTSLTGSPALSRRGATQLESLGKDSDTFISCSYALEKLGTFCYYQSQHRGRTSPLSKQRSGFPRLKNPAFSRKGKVGSMSNSTQRSTVRITAVFLHGTVGAISCGMLRKRELPLLGFGCDVRSSI